MNQHEIKKLGDMILGVYSMYGNRPNDSLVQLYLKQLGHIPFVKVEKALEQWVMFNKTNRAPTIQQLLEKIGGNDGFLEPDAAWARIPKSEYDSAIWNEEMALTWNEVKDLYENDQVGARMAFKSLYEKRIQEAREAGKKADWFFTAGFDKSQRERVLRHGYETKLIPIELVRAHMPEIEFKNPSSLALDAPKEVRERKPEEEKAAREAFEKIRKILKDSVVKDMPIDDDKPEESTWTDETAPKRAEMINFLLDMNGSFK